MRWPSRPSPSAAGGQPSEERRSLYLRDGDVIPSVVTKIDENGVWFRSSLSASTFVSNEKVKAIELAPEPPNSGAAGAAHSSQARPVAHAAPDAEDRSAHASDPRPRTATTCAGG